MENRQNVVLIAIGLVVIIGISIIAFSMRQPDQITSQSTVAPITTTDHTQGAATSTVSLIEYGDFECPACGAYAPLVTQLEQAYGDKVQFVFRNYPLVSIHPNALLGAEAAEAAGMQGKYWEMHDMLFSEQSDWSTKAPSDAKNTIDGYATQLGLNLETFHTDMASKAVADKIQSDIQIGDAGKVNHTPTFFVNLVQIPNPTSYAEFKTVLDNALTAS